MLRVNNVQVSNEVAVRVLFSDQRVGILSTLGFVNLVVFILSFTLQIIVASLDGRELVQILALLPVVTVLLHLLAALFQFLARKKQDPTLLVGASILTFLCCIWGTFSLIAFGALVVFSGMACTTNTCVGVCTCAVMLSLITIGGLTFNFIGARMLVPLVCCNTQLHDASAGAVPRGVGPSPTASAGQDDDLRGIPFTVTAVVNEGFTYDRMEHQTDGNPSS